MIGRLDTNVVLRRLVADVPDQHERAARLMRQGIVRVDTLVVIEACFVLGRHYRLTRQEQVTAMLGLLTDDGVECELELLGTAFGSYLAHASLSLEDCVLAASAERDGRGPLYTFDRDLARALPGVEVVPA